MRSSLRDRRPLLSLLAAAAVTATSLAVTVVAAPSASAAVADLRINEVESSDAGGGSDWIELTNVGVDPVDAGGLLLKDNGESNTLTIPAGTTIAPGAFVAFNTSGIGTNDSARLFDGATLVDSHSWGPHAATTYGRCPDGTGPIVTTTSTTRGAANDCTSPVRINEIESADGTPGDWVELINPGATPVDVSGFVVKDAGEPGYTFPAGTSIAAGGYLVVEEAQLGAGLDPADSVQLFLADGTTVLDTYTYTEPATTTYGRCPNGSGAFTTTQVATKGTVNNCPGDIVAGPWPGGADVATADPQNTFQSNLSGLMYEPSGTEAPGTLWAVRNGPGALYKLVRNGTTYAPAGGEWASGKLLHYPDGLGDVDAEGVTFTSAGPAAGIFVASERNNAANSVSRPAIQRYLPDTSGTELTATNDWNLSADLPGLGANLGLEAISWVPDSYLTGKGFLDANTSAPYTPSTYPNHGSGLFLVGVEQTGLVYAYALDLTSSSFTRVASFASGFPSVMELYFEQETQKLWVVCDDTCQGRSARLDVTDGVFKAVEYYERPGTMPNLNNEGFTLAPRAECAAGRKPAFWSDDSSTGGFAIRAGTVACTERGAQPVTITSTPPTSPVVGTTYTVTATGGASGNPVVIGAQPASVCTVAGSTVTFVGPGTCSVVASQAGTADFTAGNDGQAVNVLKAATTTAIAVTPTTVSATVTVTAPGSAPVSGEVTFLVGGSLIGTAPVVGGVATLTYTVPPGASRNVYAAYSGNGVLQGSQGTLVRKDPKLVATLTSSAPTSSSGWYAAPVTVAWTCTPQGSPLVGGCPDPTVLDAPGADRSITRTISAEDGGSTTTVVTVDIDLDDPTVAVGGVDDGATHPGQEPTPRCVASDATSGVDSCRVRVERSGLKVVVTATAIDRAGRLARDVVTYRVPALRVLGARHNGGQYVVERGVSYDLRALLAAAPVPRLVGPVKQGKALPNAGPSSRRMRAGEVVGGRTTWFGTVTVPVGSAGTFWRVGVRVGDKLLTIDLKVTG